MRSPTGIQLSFSAAERYLASPMSYFLHYFLRLRPDDRGSALVFGGAIDEALNSLLIAKRDGKLDIHSVDQAKIIFDESFKKTDAHLIKYSKADQDLSLLSEEDILTCDELNIPYGFMCLSKKAYLLIEAYSEQVLPKLEKVILVQENINMTNELGDSLIGLVDLVAQIDGKTFLLDNKTSSIKYAENAAEVSQQLGTYYEALKDQYKLDGVGFIVIPKNVRKKKEPRVPIEIILSNVNEQIVEQTFKMYEEVLDGIKAGEFRCTKNCCKKPWPCSYKTYCDSGGKNLTGLTYLNK